MNPITQIIGILILYLALLLVMQGFRSHRLGKEERKTFIVIGAVWAIFVFAGNYLFFKIGIMSFIPWTNNFLHTFLWIGFCLTYLYLSIRFTLPIWRQVLYFSIFSFIIKYAEQLLFGIWELEHFFFIFKGNFAYVLGWSLMDGLYPFITKFILRMMSRFVPGLII